MTTETTEQRKERQMRELAKKVTQHCINFSCCEAEFDKEEAEKDYDMVDWMRQTKSYRKQNSELLELMAAALDLVVYPDFYKE